MKKITVERYTETPQYTLPDGTIVHSATEFSAGLVEGERDDGTTWIMFMDENGSPNLFWADRDEGGGVIGEPILLQEASGG